MKIQDVYKRQDYIFRAHDYRHNLATSMYGNGVSIQGVRDYLGHSSETVSYTHLVFRIFDKDRSDIPTKYFAYNCKYQRFSFS